MARRRTMRTALILGFTAVAALPMLLAAVGGILAFRDSMSVEARRSATEHSVMAADMAVERVARQAAALNAFSSSSNLSDALAGKRKADATLREAASASGATYVLLLDPTGRVVGSSTGTRGGSFKKEPAVFNALVGRTGGGFTHLDASELSQRGLSADSTITVKPTAGGTVRHAKLDGVLALIAAAPILDRSGHPLGALLGVEVLNKSTAFVDDVTQRIGGSVTVFQDEVRVSTTVRLDDGERAWGTVASDPVQDAVLTGGGTFEGVANVVGKANQSVYRPLKDGSGNRIGMLYVGFPTAPYERATSVFALRFLGTTALAIGLAIGVGMWLAGVLSRPVAAIGAAAASVSERDLTATAPVDGTRETAALGEAFNSMVAALSAVISHASATAGRLRHISEDLGEQSASQAESASRQASAVAETTATLEELAATFASVSSGAEEVMRLAEDAVEAAQQGRSTVDDSQRELERVFSGSEQVATAADAVTEAASEIAGAVAIIESIADQTKILALNAAIEASRAGQAGRGFSVVAAEIRQLADSVSASTDRIEGVVRGIGSSTKTLADVSREQNRLAEESLSLGKHTSEAFGDILGQMMSTASAARQIAAATQQQRTAAQQVVEAMHQVSAASATTAAVSRKVSESAEEVRGSGVELDENLRGFRV